MEKKESSSDIATLQDEVLQLGRRVEMLASENQELRDRCSEAEAQQHRCVNLFLAAQRLSLARDVREVLDVTREIINNLVGSEQFGLYFLHDDNKGKGLELLSEVRAGPVELGEIARPSTDHFGIRAALQAGELYLAAERGMSPAAVIPLRLFDEVLGVLVIYDLLPQKEQFTATDQELFELISVLVTRAFLVVMEREEPGVRAQFVQRLRGALCQIAD